MSVAQATVQRDAAERVCCRPITPADAAAIAELERHGHPESMQGGARQMRLDLEDAAWEQSNLSYGLFDGSKLVGMMLVYYEADCRRLFSYFNVPVPPDIPAEECLYMADFVVRREYSRYTLRLVKTVRANLGPSHEQLPWYGFSTREVFERWQTHTKAALRADLRYVGKRSFALPEPPHEIYLVRYETRPQPRALPSDALTIVPITTQQAWSTLESDWNALLLRTPGRTAFQSYELQRIWWQHLKEEGWLLILVAYEGTKVRAIAPLGVQTTTYMGQQRKLVKFIGEHSEVDRPTILRDGEDQPAVAALLEYLFDHQELWDALLFYEQLKDGLVIATAVELCRKRPLLVGVIPGPPCPWVDLRGSWKDFLQQKSRNFRKNLQRKQKHLEQRGAVSFATYDSWPDVLHGFDLYLNVEAKSWKPQRTLGVAKSPKYLAYHNALLHAFGPQRKFHVRALLLNGEPIAATFGLSTDGQFLSLHIAHDEAYAEFSPGVLLTAYEIEEGYSRPDYSEYEFLGGFLENKVSWTAHVRETQHFYVYRRDALFRIHYAWHFHIEPAVKRMTKRLGVHSSLVRCRDALRRKLFPNRVTADD